MGVRRGKRLAAGLAWLATLAALAGGGGRQATAQARLGLELSTSQAIYHAGETFRIRVGVDNPGLPGLADFYVVAVLPDGVTAVSLTPVGIAAGSLADAASLVPAAAGVSLATPFAADVDPFFEYAWTGSEPLGSYRLYFAAVAAGELADGVAGPAAPLALETLAVTHAPPVTATPDEGRTARARITADGGEVSAIGADGTVYTLTVPAAALAGPTSIGLTPVTGVANPPLTGGFLAGARLEPEGLQFARPVTLTFTLPGPVDPAGLLGVLYQASGANLELLTPQVRGATVALTLSHFSEADVATGAIADFLALVPPLLDALPSTLPPTQVETLLSFMTGFVTLSGGHLCEAEAARALCSRVLVTAVESFTRHAADVCSRVQSLIAQGNPFGAYDQLEAVVKLADRIFEVKTNAFLFDLPGWNAPLPNLFCVAESLSLIIPLARDAAQESVERALAIDDLPASGIDDGILLLESIARHGFLLTSEQVGLTNQVDGALAALVTFTLAHAAPVCATAPPRADAVLFRPIHLLGVSKLTALLDAAGAQAFVDASAGCLMTLSPASPQVATGKDLQFGATFVVAGSVQTTGFLWQTDCPGAIGSRSGLFTAGSTGAFCEVRVEVPDSRVIGATTREFYKRTGVTIVDCAAPGQAATGGRRRARAGLASEPVCAEVTFDEVALSAEVGPEGGPFASDTESLVPGAVGTSGVAVPLQTFTLDDVILTAEASAGRTIARDAGTGVVTIELSGAVTGSKTAGQDDPPGQDLIVVALASAAVTFTLPAPHAFQFQYDLPLDSATPRARLENLDTGEVLVFEFSSGNTDGTLAAGTHRVSLACDTSVADYGFGSSALTCDATLTLSPVP